MRIGAYASSSAAAAPGAGGRLRSAARRRRADLRAKMASLLLLLPLAMSLVRLLCGAIGGLSEGSLLGAKLIARSIISGGSGGGGGGSRAAAAGAASSGAAAPPPSDLGGVGPDDVGGGSLSGHAGSELSGLLSDDVLDTEGLDGLEVLGGLYGDLGSSDLDPNTVLALLYAAFGLTAGGRGPAGLEAAAAAQLSDAYVRYLGAWLAAHVGRGFVQLCRWLQPMQLSLLHLEAPLYTSPMGQGLHGALLLLPALVLALRLPWVLPALTGAASGVWQRLKAALPASAGGSAASPAAAAGSGRGSGAGAGGSTSGKQPRGLNGAAAAAVSVGSSSGFVQRSRDGSSVTFSFDEDDDAPASAHARSAAAEVVAAGYGAGRGAVAVAAPAGAVPSGRGTGPAGVQTQSGTGRSSSNKSGSEEASRMERAGRQLAWHAGGHAQVAAAAANGIPVPPPPSHYPEGLQPQGGEALARGAVGPDNTGAAAALDADGASAADAAALAAREESGRLAVQVLRAAGMLGTAAALTVLPCSLVSSWGPWLLDVAVTAATAVASFCVFAMVWTPRGRQLLLQDDGRAPLRYCTTLLLCRAAMGAVHASQGHDWGLALLVVSTAGNALRNCAAATAASESGVWSDVINVLAPALAALVYAYSPMYLGAAAT
ncbi:hypothetical protein HYH02_003651 [Chlamydomonas schloesseri]|uniref:Uncharacterized protein n=1 Tax=Chlamydomonas schloesseri TaxID=2026947 RepID=A0A835WS67_9CHLO|nr:hypothetical protein HYH02_003651 [Chlamydomonas schloesseri]|eukprot:KAG2451876.1 hypothetical protein HYH02_003651 [Chlamydomonas schloesseri]